MRLVEAACATLGRAARNTVTLDVAVHAAVARAMDRVAALKGAVIAAHSSATCPRVLTTNVASVALARNDAFVLPFASASVSHTIGAATDRRGDTQGDQERSQ